MTRRQPDNKKPTKSDENDTIRSHNKEVKLVSKNQINKKVRPVERCLPHASQTAKLPVNKESHAPVVIDSKKADDKPKKTVKRKSEDGQPEDSAIKNPKQKRIKRRKKFKIGCEHVDFVTELGYKQYIQLAISNVFRYLSDKDVAAAFCVSKKWNYVLDQNAGLRKRRRQYVERQIELRTNLGLVSEEPNFELFA